MSQPGSSTQSARYRVLETLGRGGMGVVYRVHDLVQAREVAQKRLVEHAEPSADRTRGSAQLTSAKRAQAIASFRREYHTLAQLTHPNIIEVYDFGIDEDGPFYTMELLDGKDLRELAPLPWQETCQILRDVAAALALLHSRRLLHRDISPRNVYRTRSGAAKLIDFGAMSPMGFDRLVAGTPPFVAPESVARQALDGRADIYALGALAYFMLTGRNAYPARAISELRDVWRAPPRLPSHYAQELPDVLDALVMRMLALDAQARPSSAVELVERFAALSGSPSDDGTHGSAVQAYLTTPTLIGRSTALLGVRRRMLRALRGHGASLLVTGPSGVGRSRFLDACALEAKLSGAGVVRLGHADATDSFAGVRALFEQLRAQLSPAELDEFPRAALARCQPEQARRANTMPPSAAPTPGSEVSQRSALQAELIEYLTRVARRQSLAIIVDDVEDVDEPSLSLLASLAQLVRRNKLVLVCATAALHDARAEQAWRALRTHSRNVVLGALDVRQVEDMLRSVFGAIPNLKLLAARIHDLSAGLPRLVMELCQHLLDCGAIKSRAGGFMLQPSFTVSDLPASFRDAMALRIGALHEDARTLGATLVLAGSAMLKLDECIQLAEHADAARSFRALSELERVQLVTSDALGLRLAKGYEEVFLERLDQGTTERLHARLAALFVVETRDCIRAARHYFAAGDEPRALDALLAYAHDDSAIRHWFSEDRVVLERGIAGCVSLDRPKRDAFELRRVLCRAIAHYLEPADREPLLRFVHELFELTGASFAAELAHEPDPERRARTALERARERYESLPERERVATPGEALTILTTYIGTLASYATFVNDVPLLHGIPTLFPFTTISPGVALLERIVCTVRDFRADRQLKGMTATRANIAALEQDVPGLALAQRNETRTRLLYGLGLAEAVFGRDSALERARAIATFPEHRVNTWRVRYIASLFRARSHDAEESRGQIELLQLQGGPRQFGEGSNLEAELIALVRTDDLLGLTRVLPEIEARAVRYPGWITWRCIVAAEIERMRNQLERAIALHDEAFALAPPGQTYAYAQTASLQLDLLVQVGRAHEAVRRGRERVALAHQHDVDSVWVVEISLAVAYAAAGEHDQARAEIERLLRFIDEGELYGIYRGSVFEAAARIAIETADAQTFQQYFDRAWEEYGRGLYPSLATRLEKLLTLARRKKLVGVNQEAEAERSSTERVRSELARAHNPTDRATRALALLLEASHAVAGHLYGVSDADIELLASRAKSPPSPELENMIRRFLHTESQDELTVSVHELAQQRPSMRVAQIDDGGMRYFAFLLKSDHGPRAVAAGVVTLAFADDKPAQLATPLTAAISAELLASHDVTGLTLSS